MHVAAEDGDAGQQVLIDVFGVARRSAPLEPQQAPWGGRPDLQGIGFRVCVLDLGASFRSQMSWRVHKNDSVCVLDLVFLREGC